MNITQKKELKGEKTKGIRNINIELLRIISMIMIIIMHLLGHGGILDNVKPYTANYMLVWTINALAFVSVNCYVLISGYFLVDSKFSVKKVLIIWGQIIFYSIAIYVIALSSGLISMNIKTAIIAFLPVLGKQYWFATTYVALYFLFPFLNLMIKAMTKKEMQRLLITIIFMFSLWPNLIPFSKTLQSGGGYGIVWFVCLYFISAYIKLHYVSTCKPVIYLIVYILFSMLLIISKLTLEYLGTHILGGSIWLGSFYTYNSILVLIGSVALFLFFINTKKTNNKIASKVILSLSGLTFGVYLIHDNGAVRNILWNRLGTENLANSQGLILAMIVYVILIYLSCSMIEYVRQIVFKKVGKVIKEVRRS
jgi:surface polysaccharide O-acyltransferase-like enzyme